MRWLV